MNIKKDKILVVLYSHPELFPPTLNAIINLSDYFKQVHVLYLKCKKDEWPFPANVHLHGTGKIISTIDLMRSSLFKRLGYHFRFLNKLFFCLLYKQPQVVLLYDPYPTLFFKIAKSFPFLKRSFIWYHNHDVIEQSQDQSGLIPLLKKAEKSVLEKAQLFTLPANERKVFYDIDSLKAKYATLPNFPSLKVFTKVPLRQITDKVVIFFRGSIAKGRGIEDLIKLLPISVNGKPVHFDITGFCYNEQFLEELTQLIKERKLEQFVRLNNREAVSYGEIPEEGKHAHIGWAFYSNSSSMDKTMGTASNKFFESCALGLPVLFNGENIFKDYERFPWAVPVHLNKDSLMEKLLFLVNNYAEISGKSREQFLNELNFEKGFEEVMKLV